MTTLREAPGLPAECLRRTVFLAGPTACGKSAIAVRLARLIGGEIIGADATQIYSALPILAAAPEPALLQAVPHHLIGCLPPDREISVFDYLRMARDTVADVIARGRTPVIAGGAGLYIQALVFGLAPAPPPSPELRRQFAKLSPAELAARLKRDAPAWAAVTDLSNPRRVQRALERALLGQKEPPQPGWSGGTPAGLNAFFLTRPRPELRQRIALRVRAMLQGGAVEEVAALGPRPPARPPIGFREIQDHLRGALTPDECASRIETATWQYARRQMTWFNARPWLRRLDLSGLEHNGLDPAAVIAEQVR